MPKARIFRGSPANLARLAAALRRGELVGIPTETVYGLAGNALDPRACRAIFRAKGRPTADPLIVHVHDWAQVEKLAEVNDAARRLAARFWPGPLTMVLPKRECVDDIVTSGLPSVAIRMPAHPLFRRLLKRCGLPLAAPSANPFGYISPTSAAHVREGLGDRIRHILDGGSCPIGVESTIVDLRRPASPVLLRPGAISAAQIAGVLGVAVVARSQRSAASRDLPQVAPGMLKRHYSPRTPLTLHGRIDEAAWRRSGPDEAWLLLRKPAGVAPANIRWLDARGELKGVARRLFALLRELDAGGFRHIHAELARGEGLAEAINDRLRRAAAKA